ncbi:hypothetical protein YC2023_014269 [Brassica napus]
MRIKIVPKTNHRNQGIQKIPRTKSFSNKSLKDICTCSSVLFLSNPNIVECVYTTGTEIANRAKVNCIQNNWAVNVVSMLWFSYILFYSIDCFKVGMYQQVHDDQ